MRVIINSVSCGGDSCSDSCNLCLVLTVLEGTFSLTQGCYGGSPSPFDTYDFMLTLFFLLNCFT